MIAGLAWREPAALLLLALPILVLLLARRLERPRPIATGTLDLWARIPPPLATSRGGARARIPPAVRLLALGLALGTLALAGPRTGAEGAPRDWTLAVDRSPSTGLPLGSGARLDRALELAERWLAGRAGPRDRILREDAGISPDGAPDWSGRDAAGALFVTDRAPIPLPERAGVFASGGPAVPGPIAVDGSARIDWDGTNLARVEGGAPARSVALGAEMPPVLAAVVRSWAEARGFAVDAAAGEAGVALAISTGGGGARRAVLAGRDGWSALGESAGEAPTSDAAGPLEAWLADPSGRALVSFGPGRVATSLVALADPRGDPAAFAVSWAALLDRAALPPAGVVPLLERLEAGPELARPPAPEAPDPEGGRAGPRAGPRAEIDAWLALAALAATLAAACLSAPGRALLRRGA